MLPIAVAQLQISWLIHCYREQAPSHIGFVVVLRDLYAFGQQHVHQPNQG